jgi:hypothetical protein
VIDGIGDSAWQDLGPRIMPPNTSRLVGYFGRLHITKGRDNKALVQDPIVRRFEKSISAVITKNELADEMADQRAFRASEATAFFLQDMIHFKRLNPTAGPLELLKRAKEAQKEALEIFREDAAEPLPEVDLDKMDPTKNALFRDGPSLDLAIQEFNATKGTSGKLKAIAEQYRMDPNAFINAQKALFKKPK